MRVCPRCNLKYPDDNDKCFVDGVALEEAPDPWLGTTINGRYLVEDKIGEGGMATVYRARHTLVDRPIALKVMNPQLASDDSLRERFRREAKNGAALQHPNIIEINDYGDTEDGTAFMVMELLDGSTLDDLIAQGPMSPEQVASLGLQMAQGLARAHDFDVLHRDLKPENIFVCRPREGAQLVKILDFGIARSLHDSRLTNAGEIFGTPQYMAPERVTSIDAGASADLYALGVILFEMVTGKLPFEAEEITGYMIKHMQEAPPKPSELAPKCPRRLEELILELLAKKPEDRPVDAHQVIKELQPLAPDDVRASVVPPSATPSRPIAAPTLPPTTLERWARRTALFDEMLARAFPNGGAPDNLGKLLEGSRADLQQVQVLRSQGLTEQRKLEALEAEARESRARLGHAVNRLAEDLSQARESARAARSEVSPYFEHEDQAQQAYREAYERLQKLGGLQLLEEPNEDVASTLKDAGEALDRWVLNRGAADKARRWVEAKEREVEDLEYQVSMLRQQLEKVETDYEHNRKASEDIVAHNGKEAERLERDLVARATEFCTELRPRQELGDLFAKLESEGAA